MKKKKWPFIYVAVITILTYIPILLTVVYSFNASKLTSVWEGLSLKWYRELFRDRDLGEALINSLILAVLSCTFAVLIGTSGALGMSRRKRKLNEAVAYVSTLPIMIPEIILGMVFLSVFSLMGLPFGMVTLVIAHTTFCVPYIFTMVRARLVGMDHSLEEAALDLGASKWQVFRDVILPQILPAILSGVLLAFAMSFDDLAFFTHLLNRRSDFHLCALLMRCGVFKSILSYLERHVMRPFVRSYGLISSVTLSPGRMRMKFMRSLPEM